MDRGRRRAYRCDRMRPDEYRCECGHLATQHADDSDERCTVIGCGCESFVPDEESWRALAQHMAGRSDEVLAAVERALRSQDR